MFCNTLTARFSHLFFTLALISLAAFPANAQNSLSGAKPRHSVSVLDSTKDQDGLVGSVRRVKTETAKVEIKEGQPVEGPLQILELTTYGIKGNRTENVSYPDTDSLVGKEEYKYDARGNITEMTLRDDRGAIVQLPYGLEGFAPNRHLIKEDGKSLVADETSQFMVIEFDRNEKRILVSHTKIWEQAKAQEQEAAKKEQRAESDKARKVVKNIQSKVEKATLGDLGALAEIKEKLRKEEEK